MKIPQIPKYRCGKIVKVNITSKLVTQLLFTTRYVDVGRYVAIDSTVGLHPTLVHIHCKLRSQHSFTCQKEIGNEKEYEIWFLL